MDRSGLKAASVNVEKIIADIRRQIEKEQEKTYSEDDILRLVNINPEDPIDKRAVRGDFWRALHSENEAGDALEFVNLNAYLGRGTSTKHKILRKIRKVFWPFARIFFNTGYLFSVLNDNVQLMHNLIYELTLLRIDNDRLRDGYQVIIHKLNQIEARQRELDKLISEQNGNKKRK